MTCRLAKIFLAATMGLFPFLACFATDRNVEISTAYSPKQIGFSFYTRCNNVDMPDGNLFRIMADMDGIIGGQTTKPGLKIAYNRLYCLRYWLGNKGTRASFFAGPGISAGYVQDSKRGFGTMTSFCGMIGWNFTYSNDISISFGFSGELGAYFKSNTSHDTTLKLYKNGLKGIILPEISIGYRF